MRAIVIDAEKREVREVEFDGKNALEFLQKCVGGNIETAYRMKARDFLFVNEEGLFMDFNYAFTYHGAPQHYYVGNGVILGSDSMGEERSAKVSLEEVKAFVKWVEVS